ncbi:MAG: hypothetical protein K6F82_04480 [Sphaerochaetaceae bacterium]|nr:hypothetical protein [Sphaerochaetaceae bacterium]
MKDKEVIEVSDKHVVLRTVLFVALIGIAVAAFATAIVSIGHKDPGWQVIEAATDADVPFYSSSIGLSYYMEGSSSEIRQNISTLSGLYSKSLKRMYILFDSENEYPGYVNLATINNNLGKEIAVPQEIFFVLTDFYAKTLSGEANLFCNLAYEAEQVLLTSENYDAEYEAERIAALKSVCSDLSNFSLEVLDPEKYIITFNVSDAVLETAKAYEASDSYLGLNELYFYYMTYLVGQSLADNGYPDAYFYAK